MKLDSSSAPARARAQHGVRSRRVDAGLVPLTDVRFLVALAVLVVNDHVLKAAYGNWVTGKLSDVAGLVVLPVVLAVVVGRVRGRDSVVPAAAAVGVWFAAMKTVPSVAAVTERLFELVSGAPSSIVVDPSDLVGLAGLAIAVVAVRRPVPIFTGDAVRIVVLGVAVLACAATSNDSGTIQDLGLDDSGQVISRAIYADYVGEELADDEGIPAGSTGLGVFETEACLDVSDGDSCFRLVEGRVERSVGDGWELEWQVFDLPLVIRSVGGGLDYAPSLHARDIVAAPDGTVHVSFDGIRSVTRTAGGDWSPGASAFRPITALTLLALAGFGGVVLAAAAGRRGVLLLAAALAVGATMAMFAGWSSTSVFAGITTTGGTIAAVLALIVAVIGLAGRQAWSRLIFMVGAAGIVLAYALLLFWKFRVGAPANLVYVAVGAMALFALIAAGLGLAGIGMKPTSLTPVAVDQSGDADSGSTAP